MSQTLRDAVVEIETHFSSSYGSTSYVQYPNEPSGNPTGSAWISFDIEIPEGEAITMDLGTSELTGFVDVNIYTPKNEGVWDSLIDIADKVRTALSNVHLTNVYFDASSGLRSAPDEAEFYVANITTFFSITERN